MKKIILWTMYYLLIASLVVFGLFGDVGYERQFMGDEANNYNHSQYAFIRQ